MVKNINPLIFRLIINQNHYSIWFIIKKSYFINIKEDNKIRNYINIFLKKEKYIIIYEIFYIKIKKFLNLIKIIIYIGIKNFLIKNIKKKLNKIRIKIKKKINYTNFNIEIIKIINIYEYPNIISKFIIKQLKKKVSFFKIIKKTIELTENTCIKGIKIKISGKIFNKEIKNNEWFKEGIIPLQTIKSKVYFCLYKIKTIYGILSIKVWIFF
uniref:Small ribosomal subunit protein uS3c n=1 Tax=Ombrophytum subterraneum TaxID=50155 RepID=A0A8E7IVF7_9MAGN|nr:ribosomal protein S3 [Ombrophytum subterraneum]